VTYTKRHLDSVDKIFHQLDAEWRAGMSDAANRKADALTKKQKRALYLKGLKETARFVQRGRKQGKWKLVPLFSATVDPDAQLTRRKGLWKLAGRPKVTLGRLTRVRKRRRR
jgi:hypothetical protein